LRALDDAFRKQLAAKEAFLREQMDTLRRERDEAAAAADERVARAEAEMRELLVETERTKRAISLGAISVRRMPMHRTAWSRTWRSREDSRRRLRSVASACCVLFLINYIII
jgi:hypothetical protein